MLKTKIPCVNLRSRTPIDLLRAYPDKALTIIQATRRMYGKPAYAASSLALPLADRLSHRWLKRTNNPYLYEIESFSSVLDTAGVYAFNLSYEWGCTTGIYRTGENVTLLRILDWPFPQIGRQAMTVQQYGAAGMFYNITWPGMAGVYNAMAPGRFSVAINQAPMRAHSMTYTGDWLINRIIARRQKGLPPSHLLRQVCEYANNYDTAKRLLTTTPLAMPAIFVLAGTRPGQGCVIERLENTAAVGELSASQQICAANHFNSGSFTSGRNWRPREIDSHGRWRQAYSIHGHDLEAPDFTWLQGPMVNMNTRLAIITNAATDRLVIQGFEGVSPVTELFRLSDCRPELAAVESKSAQHAALSQERLAAEIELV